MGEPRTGESIAVDPPRDGGNAGPRGLRSYRAFLALPRTGPVLVSSLIGRMPLGILPLAILLSVRHAGGSYAVAGAAVGAFAIGQAALTPVTGILIDRFGRRPVLLPCACVHGVFLVAFVLEAKAGSFTVLVILAGLIGGTVPPISASVRSAWPDITPTVTLREVAYALDALSQELIWIIGPAFVSVLADVFAPQDAVLLSAGLTLAGTAMLIRLHLPEARGVSARSPVRARALSSPGLRALLASMVLAGVSLGVLAVALPATAATVGVPGGLLLTTFSIGSLLGGVYYGSHAWRVPVFVRYRALLLSFGLCVLPMAAATTLGAAVPLSLLAGVSFSPVLACQFTLIGALALPGTVTEAFTWNTTSIVGGTAIGSALAGLQIDASGDRAAFVSGAVAALLGAVVATATRRRIEPVSNGAN
jgi:MFS family permease